MLTPVYTSGLFISSINEMPDEWQVKSRADIRLLLPSSA